MAEDLPLEDVDPEQGLFSLVPHRPFAEAERAAVEDVDG